MLPNQVASIVRAVLPVATVVAFLVAHGFSPDEAQLLIDSAISLVVTLGCVGWGMWSNRRAAVIKDAVALPLKADEVAILLDKIAKLEKVHKVEVSADLARATESPKVVTKR